MKAIAGRVISGGAEIGRKAVCFDGPCIVDIIDISLFPVVYETVPLQDFGDCYIAAGFIDVHVNGAGGSVFQFEFDASGLDRAASAIRASGTMYFIPTISATDAEEYASVRDNLRRFKHRNGSMLGLHFEGPFISAKKPGFGRPECVSVHNVHPRDIYGDLLEDMVVTMTIAPESISRADVMGMMRDGVIVSLGHSESSSLDCVPLIDSGVRGATHLFNGMPPISGREVGLAGVCLESPKVYCSVIADGYHLSSDSLRLIWRTKASDRIMVITDGMPPLGADISEFMYRGKKIIRSEHGRLIDSVGILSGTDKSQLAMCKNIKNSTGARTDKIIDAVTRAPSQFLGLAHQIGDIQVGMRSSFTVFSEDFRVKASIFEGNHVCDVAS